MNDAVYLRTKTRNAKDFLRTVKYIKILMRHETKAKGNHKGTTYDINITLRSYYMDITDGNINIER